MNDAFQCFETHLDQIWALLLRNKVSDTKAMRLLGLYLNLYEGRMKLKWQNQREDSKQIRLIIGRILDAITFMLGEIGGSLPKSEFQNLLTHTSALYKWGLE